MNKKSITRDSLIEHGIGAFLANGYDGVGLDEILKATGVPKGSFYHFFRSKEAFACAVIEAYSTHYSAIRKDLFSNLKEPPSARLRRYFKRLEQELAKSLSTGGCLLGVFACSSRRHGSDITERLKQSFREWENSLQRVISEGQRVGDIASDRDARLVAAILIDAYEGALVRVRAYGTLAPFKRFMKDVLEPVLSAGASATR